MSLNSRRTQRARVNRNMRDLSVEERDTSRAACIVCLCTDHFCEVLTCRVDRERYGSTCHRNAIDEENDLRTVVGHCDVSPTAGRHHAAGTINEHSAGQIGTKAAPGLGVEGKRVNTVLTL